MCVYLAEDVGGWVYGDTVEQQLIMDVVSHAGAVAAAVQATVRRDGLASSHR